MKEQPRRSPCPINHSLELFGDKWTLLIARDLLLFGKTSYSEFLLSPEGISTNILADRLKQLESNQLVDKLADPGNGKKYLYIPTDRCISLMPLLVELIQWGANDNGNGLTPSNTLKQIRKDRQAFILGEQKRCKSQVKKLKASIGSANR